MTTNSDRYMRGIRVIGACAMSFLVVSCSSTITGKPVGALTLEEAVRLHMTKPTVVEWLQKTDAQAIYFPQQHKWKINLKDGMIFYTEYRDANGVLWVDAIDPRSDNPDVIKKLEALKPEYEKAMRVDKPPDLTGAEPDSFRKNLGKVVTLRGCLEQGKQGLCLFRATATNVVFYVISDAPSGGSYTYPILWERLMHKQVRVMGELRFRSFDRTNKTQLMQVPPDYYYMVLQHTSIEELDSK